jgi:DNA helicase HerA-like ATPase
VRKYGIGLVMAHQFVDQLPDDVLAAVLGNVGTKIVFRIGPRDAPRVGSFLPGVSTSELLRMPNFTALVEILVDGIPCGPITVMTPPPPTRLTRE